MVHFDFRGFITGEGFFFKFSEVLVLKYSMKKVCKANRYTVAAGSFSQMVASELHDMENAPHVLVLIDKILPGPTAVVHDT